MCDHIFVYTRSSLQVLSPFVTIQTGGGAGPRRRALSWLSDAWAVAWASAPVSVRVLSVWSTSPTSRPRRGTEFVLNAYVLLIKHSAYPFMICVYYPVNKPPYNHVLTKHARSCAHSHIQRREAERVSAVPTRTQHSTRLRSGSYLPSLAATAIKERAQADDGTGRSEADRSASDEGLHRRVGQVDRSVRARGRRSA